MRKRSLWIAVCGCLFSGAAPAEGDPVAGRQKAQVCASCHGPAGVSPNPQFPHLAGQYPDYLAKALKDYQTGARKNPIMRGFAGSLSGRDIQDLAAYFSQQQKLSVLPPR